MRSSRGWQDRGGVHAMSQKQTSGLYSTPKWLLQTLTQQRVAFISLVACPPVLQSSPQGLACKPLPAVQGAGRAQRGPRWLRAGVPAVPRPPRRPPQGDAEADGHPGVWWKWPKVWKCHFPEWPSLFWDGFPSRCTWYFQLVTGAPDRSPKEHWDPSKGNFQKPLVFILLPNLFVTFRKVKQIFGGDHCRHSSKVQQRGLIWFPRPIGPRRSNIGGGLVKLA